MDEHTAYIRNQSMSTLIEAVNGGDLASVQRLLEEDEMWIQERDKV